MPRKKKTTEPTQTDEERLAELNELFDLGCRETFAETFDSLVFTNKRTRGGQLLTRDLKLTRDDWDQLKKEAHLVYTKQSSLSVRKRAMVYDIATHVRTVTIKAIDKQRPDLTKDLIKSTEVST